MFSTANSVYFRGSSATAIPVLSYASNVFSIGQGVAANSNNTKLYGYNLMFCTGVGGTEYIRVNSSGNVGIGSASPSEKLYVNGNIKATGNLLPAVESSSDIGSSTLP